MNVETHEDRRATPSPRPTAAQGRTPREPGSASCTRSLVAARVGLVASAAGLALTILLGAAGPNANTAAVRGPLTVLPPLPPVASQPIVWLSVLLAGVGLSASLLAYAHGWRPDPARLLMLSAGAVVLLVNLTPVGSSDTASYAAYGRLYATGMDPYKYSPGWLGGTYATVVAPVWLHTALAGVACGFKANAALVGAGLAWERLRRQDYLGLVRLGAAALAVVVGAYLLAGRYALRPLFEATGLVGIESPWSLVGAAVNLVAGPDLAAVVTRFGWPCALVPVAVLLFRLLPENAPRALRTQFALSFAWVLVAPWIMPWYTALAWGFHAQLPPNRLTRWLVIYTVVLACVHNSGGHPMG
ncbi:MAG: hypothetical protein JWO67_5342 [Streptosporangiaceae bacterium]|nr:hypothetical protein [Streptosporangiaceae bacterium]